MKQEKAKEKIMTVGEAYGLNQALNDLTTSVPTMKGRLLHSLAYNESKLESYLKKIDKRQQKIIKKYVELDKKGEFVFTKPSDKELAKGERPQYIYKKESDRKVAEKEMNDLMKEPVNDVKFHKILKNDFDNLDIVPARNTRIILIIDYLLTDIALV